MPVTCKRTIKEQGEDGTQGETEITFKRFLFRRNWFMLAQTDGAEYVPPAIPSPPGAGDTLTANEPRPSIFTALQEEFGLKLKSARGPVEVLVIDNVSKPTEN
jgi:uncharacterized protein (TIGR03435 family)